MNTKLLLTAALAGVLAAGVASANEEKKAEYKCYGIAKAGKNGCAAKDKSHACAGQAKKDNDANDFALVADKAACEKAGGKGE